MGILRRYVKTVIFLLWSKINIQAKPEPIWETVSQMCRRATRPGKRRASVTLEELSEYYKLSRYLEMLKEELTRLRAKAYGVGSAKPEISSGAHGGCKSDRTGEAAAKLADMDEELCVLTRECELARERIFRYITVEVAGKDKMTASIMYWRFIGRESWYKVGARTGNTADNCRVTVKRYLQKHG